MHLRKASAEWIENKIKVLKHYDIQKIGLAHCTGDKAVEKMTAVFLDAYFNCSVGSRIML